MAKNVLFDDIGFALATEASGDLAEFDTGDFTQLVVQATATSNMSFILQVSPDGTLWLDETVLGIAPNGLATASSDVAFAHARLRFVVTGSAAVASVRVLGRL